MGQQETRQGRLFVGHYGINHIEILITSDTKMVSLMGHNYANQTGILTSACH